MPIVSRNLLREQSEIISGGGLQILKYCKIGKLWPSLHTSIKNCDIPDATDGKIVTLPSVTCKCIFCAGCP